SFFSSYYINHSDLNSFPTRRSSDLRAYANGLLWDYIRAMGVYRCPLDNTNSTTWKNRAQKLSTYLMNGAVGGYGKISPNSYKARSEEHTSELQSRGHLVCRLLLEKK